MSSNVKTALCDTRASVALSKAMDATPDEVPSQRSLVEAGHPAIRVENVSKHYLMFARPEDRLKQSIVPKLQRLAGRVPTSYFTDFCALSRVSFQINRGQTVGIIGRNGSGKSTLLQIICGTQRPSSGTVEVNGRIAALLELGAGFNPEFTGRENVYMNAAILGLSRAEIDQRFDAIANFADIGAFIEHPVKMYSSGMYVRLAFSVAVSTDPDILIVDEALSVGDESFQRKCFARIEDIKAKGATILFVSHSAQTLVQLCDRAILIDGGEKLLDGRPKLVVAQYHRLVNASAAGALAIRASIIERRDASRESEVTRQKVAVYETGDVAAFESRLVAAEAHPEKGGNADAMNLPDGDRPTCDLSARTASDGDGADYFDPNMNAQSTMFLEERGARIRDVRITTLDGKLVNVLRMGRRYVVDYYADFVAEVTEVGFGMFVNTTSGLGLAGAQTVFSPNQRTMKVSAGATIHVEYEFTSIFLPAAYFLTCGIFGTVGGNQVVVHRIVDALMFRVAPEEDLIAIGRVDIGALPRITMSTTP